MPIIRLICILTLSLWLTHCTSSAISMQPLAANSIVLAFGDSLTFGTGGGSAQANYPYDLALLIKHPVINAGVPGEETKDSLLRLMSELDKHHPQLVLLCLGGNDMLRKRPNDLTKQNLINLIKQIKLTGAQVVLIAVPYPSLRLAIPEFYSEVATELQIPIEKNLLATLLNKPQNKSDMIHLNAQGYHLFAVGLAKFLADHGALGEASHAS
jgi:acyl-CoA thioesterase-1